MEMMTLKNTQSSNYSPSNDYDEQVGKMMVFSQTGYHSTNFHKGKRNIRDFIGQPSNDNDLGQ